MTGEEKTIDDFFTHWTARYKITASVGAGLEYSKAYQAWLEYQVRMNYEVERQRRVIETLRSQSDFHKRKAEQWLAAYQNSRVKHVGDYTRFFVRRPRMRRLIVFLMRL